MGIPGSLRIQLVKKTYLNALLSRAEKNAPRWITRLNLSPDLLEKLTHSGEHGGPGGAGLENNNYLPKTTSSSSGSNNIKSFKSPAGEILRVKSGLAKPVISSSARQQRVMELRSALAPPAPRVAHQSKITPLQRTTFSVDNPLHLSRLKVPPPPPPSVDNPLRFSRHETIVGLEGTRDLLSQMKQRFGER